MVEKPFEKRISEPPLIQGSFWRDRMVRNQMFFYHIVPVPGTGTIEGDLKNETGSDLSAATPPKEEDCLELGKDVPRVSSSDGQGRPVSHHSLQVR